MSQKNYYEKKAAGFDRGLLYTRNNRNHMRKIEKICELLDLDRQPTGVKILEIGTGTGIHVDYLINKYPGISYTGVDISQGMLKEAEKKLYNGDICLIAGDGHRLPVRSDKFDLVVISGTLHHFSDPCQGIGEAMRVLKNDGRLAIMEPNWLFPTNFIPAITNKQEHGILKMTTSNFLRWSKAIGLSSPVIGHLLYTPPIPVVMSKFYNGVDDTLKHLPIISKASIMIYMTGVKREL